MQVTMENLLRARDRAPGNFDEAFTESKQVLQEELGNLRTLVAQFSDFGKMAPPRLQPLNVNDAVRSAVKTLEPQFNATGRPPIMPELYLDEAMRTIDADPAQLQKAVQNLLELSLNAMAAGGTLTIRTAQKRNVARVEISDTGAGTVSENGRAFASYDSLHGDGGLSFAIAQAVVSDHGGKMHVESVPGVGTTYRIEFASKGPGVASAAAVPPSVVKKEKVTRREPMRQFIPSAQPEPAAALSDASSDK
jgi:signal transduction histidine kinase